MKDLIKKLVEAWGPSGFEHHVRDIIRAEVEPLADEIRIDALGNLICRVGEKKKNGLRIMVAAHMDEIGIMVSHIDRQGFLRFTNIGTVLRTTLYGNRVKFENGTILSVGLERPLSSMRSIPPLSSFFLDNFNSDGDPVNLNVGDPAIFWRTMHESGNRIIAKSLDDRIGCAILIETMRKLKKKIPHEIFFVFTVQEEVGTRGAQTAAYAIEPDFGIAVDVTPSGDVPQSDHNSIELGKGAVIKIMDVGHIVPPAVRILMINVAEDNNIPYQREILRTGSTDAKAIQLVGSGVPAGAISVPVRYVHTASETVDLRDVRACVDLLRAILSNPAKNPAPGL